MGNAMSLIIMKNVYLMEEIVSTRKRHLIGLLANMDRDKDQFWLEENKYLSFLYAFKMK